MTLNEQINTISFASIASAGSGLRDLQLPRDQFGPAIGVALSLSSTRALRMTRGLLGTAADIDEAANDADALVEWAARQGGDERQLVSKALRLAGGEVLLVDRVARLPRTEARPFISEWLADGGDPRAIATWLQTVGRVLQENDATVPGTSGSLIDWITEAAEDVVDAIKEAVETIVDAVVTAGQTIAEVIETLADWTIEELGHLVSALLEAGRSVGELLGEAVDAGVTMFKKVVKALIDIGHTVVNVLSDIATQTIGVIGDAIRALREIGQSFADILAQAVQLAVAGFKKVVEALLDIGKSVVQILGAALSAAANVLRSTLDALLSLGHSLTQLIGDVITGQRSLVEAFTQALRDIGRSVGSILTAAASAVAGAVSEITRALVAIGETIVELAEWAADAAIGFAREVVAALVDAGKTVVELVSAVAQRALKVMRTVIDGLYELGWTFTQLLADLANIGKDLLARFLKAAFALGATLVEFIGETLNRTYALAKEMIEAALEAGAKLADLLLEAASDGYFTLRRMVFGVLDAVGLGEVMRWTLSRLEDFTDDVFHEVMTALRYAEAALVDVLDWAIDKSEVAFNAVVAAWESVSEDLRDLYAWASNLTSTVAATVWQRIGQATVKLRNSVSYVLTYLEKDFLPGVARFVKGLLAAGYELGDLLVRVAARSVALVAEVVVELLEAGFTLAQILLETAINPSNALDNLLSGLRVLDQSWSDIMAAASDAGDDIVAEVVETAQRLEEPLSEMLQGALEVGGGLFGLVVAQLFNSLASYRNLTAAEKREAEKVFGDSIDLDLVSVSQESLDNRVIFEVQTFFQSFGGGAPSPRAFVTGTLINFSASTTISNEILVHELTHVWQNFETGPMYLAEAIHAQVVDPNAYNYGYTNSTTGAGAEAELQAANGDFESFNREQQGQIAMHYYHRAFVESPPLDVSDWQPYIDQIRAAA
ncbi:MAG: hypothetical protein V3U76_12850 [Granulosicoccus sp.]